MPKLQFTRTFKYFTLIYFENLTLSYKCNKFFARTLLSKTLNDLVIYCENNLIFFHISGAAKAMTSDPSNPESANTRKKEQQTPLCETVRVELIRLRRNDDPKNN